MSHSYVIICQTIFNCTLYKFKVQTVKNAVEKTQNVNWTIEEYCAIV